MPADELDGVDLGGRRIIKKAGVPIYSPSNYAELRYWLLRLVGPDYTGPQAIRYPRGGEVKALAQYGCTGRAYDFLTGGPEADTVLVSYGSEVEDVLAAASLLEAEGVPCRVCKLVKIFPFTDDFVHEIERFKTVLFAEECVRQGSIGQQLAARLLADGWRGAFLHRAVDNTKLTHATVPELKEIQGLDAGSLAQAVRQALAADQEKEQSR